MSPLISFLIEQGLPRETLSIVVFAPILIALIVAARHVVGFRTLGVYAPFILTFALVRMGLWNGILVLLLVATVGIFMRTILRPLQLLHLPRVGLGMVGALGSFVALFAVQAYQGQQALFAFTPITFFALLVLIEDFFSARLERRPAAVLRYLGETFMIALLGFLLASSRPLETLFFTHPWLPFVASAATLVFLGRWTGLRITEYIRFRKLM